MGNKNQKDSVLFCRQIDELGISLKNKYPDIEDKAMHLDMPERIKITQEHIDLLRSKIGNNIEDIIFPRSLYGLISSFAREVNKILVINNPGKGLEFVPYGFYKNLYKFESVDHSISFEYGVGARSGYGLDVDFQNKFEGSYSSFDDFIELMRNAENAYTLFDSKISVVTNKQNFRFHTESTWEHDDLKEETQTESGIYLSSEYLLPESRSNYKSSIKLRMLENLDVKLVMEITGLTDEEFRRGILDFNRRYNILAEEIEKFLREKYGLKIKSDWITDSVLKELKIFFDEKNEKEFSNKIANILLWKTNIETLPKVYFDRVERKYMGMNDDSSPLAS